MKRNYYRNKYKLEDKSNYEYLKFILSSINRDLYLLTYDYIASSLKNLKTNLLNLKKVISNFNLYLKRLSSIDSIVYFIELKYKRNNFLVHVHYLLFIDKFDYDMKNKLSEYLKNKLPQIKTSNIPFIGIREFNSAFFDIRIIKDKVKFMGEEVMMYFYQLKDTLNKKVEYADYFKEYNILDIPIEKEAKFFDTISGLQLFNFTGIYSSRKKFISFCKIGKK